MSEPVIIAGRIASQDTYDRGSSKFRTIRVDPSTHALVTIGYAHYEAHNGSSYFIYYSVDNIGGLTTPNDTMTLSFTTPATPYYHMTFHGISGSAAQLQFIEGKTGGGTDPTGVLPVYNHNRNSTNTSSITDVAGANVGNVSYDALVFTGGTTLVNDYIGTDDNPVSQTGGSHRSGTELILKASTAYQLVLVDTATVPATLAMSWYEHTDKD